MGLIRFIQAHNRNKELRKTRELEEQKLDVMENWELNKIRSRSQLQNQGINKLTSNKTEEIQELFELAQDYRYAKSNYNEALEIYREIIRKYPDSRQAELSHEEIDKIEGEDEKPKPSKKEKSEEFDEAIQHIRMRYAKGEITEEEYEKIKKKLEG